jgi:NADP-reducing hydrogenase subunit HndB
MPQLKSLDELRSLRTRLQQDIKTRTESSTTVTVGMGTCGIAAGAREVMQAFLDELSVRKMDAHVVTTGCIGMCAKEPLVDIQQAGGPRITYGNVDTTMVPRIIEEHLVQGHVVQSWVVGGHGEAPAARG